MIIITGASEGLGAEVAHVAQECHIPVTNIARRANPDAEHNIAADLSTLEGIDQAVKAIRTIKKPTALVLNAGVLSLQLLDQIDAKEYDRVMNINVRAPLLMISQLSDWIREHGVDIVIVNSIASRHPYTGQFIYDISKWALRGLTEDIRLELKNTSSRIIGVYPDMLDTNMAGNMPRPLPKSKHPTISSREVARLIVQAIQSPKTMEVRDIIIERKS